jgi:hypothetical protein
MIGERFFSDFFKTPDNDWAEPYMVASPEVVREALELAKGQPPESNLMPYIDIIHAAKNLGLKVTRNPP